MFLPVKKVSTNKCIITPQDAVCWLRIYVSFFVGQKQVKKPKSRFFCYWSNFSSWHELWLVSIECVNDYQFFIIVWVLISIIYRIIYSLLSSMFKVILDISNYLLFVTEIRRSLFNEIVIIHYVTRKGICGLDCIFSII